MTVAELIEELSKYPPETPIRRFSPDDRAANDGPAADDVEVVAVIARDGHVVIV